MIVSIVCFILLIALFIRVIERTNSKDNYGRYLFWILIIILGATIIYFLLTKILPLLRYTIFSG